MTIEFDSVSFVYDIPTAPQGLVLSDISFELTKPEIVALAGPSGAGKTTLIQLFTGLLRPMSGRVLIDGEDLWTSRRLRHQARRRIGLVFQFPESQLFAETVFEDVAFGPRNLRCPESEVRQRVEEALHEVGLEPERFASRSPFHLSEGEKRRAALAGTLAMRPEMLVLDEPTAALDPAGVMRVKEILQRLHSKGVSIVWISHDLDLLFEVAERFLLLRGGQIFFDGPKLDLRRHVELLQRAGLEMPRLFHLIRRLREAGWDVPDEVTSFGALRDWFRDRTSASTASIAKSVAPSHLCDT